jgi:hypothetical protein
MQRGVIAFIAATSKATQLRPLNLSAVCVNRFERKSMNEVDQQECPSCKVHPHRQACCQNCEDARIAKARSEGRADQREADAEKAFKEINNAGFNQLAAITAAVIREGKVE